MDIALELLRQSPKLETCTLSIFYRTNFHTPQPICMEHMRQLSVTDYSHSDVHFFKHTTLPNLHSLDYVQVSARGRDLLPVLSCLDAPGRLTSLALSTPPSIHDLAHCLTLFPMLQKLVLHRDRLALVHNIPPILPFFSLLTPPPQNLSAIICPHLHDICLLGINGGSDRELLALVEARLTSGHNISPLSRVHAVFPRDREVDISPQLAAAGLSFTRRYLTEDMATYRRSEPVNARRPLDADADWGVLSTTWLAEYAEPPV
ncbi:hypothetical protein C8R44DRAFT_880604 [Mycena epipterygia]|nr:hypothetical protein C8R44DRAFT_880604 [Mycena epipterygia]